MSNKKDEVKIIYSHSSQQTNSLLEPVRITRTTGAGIISGNTMRVGVSVCDLNHDQFSKTTGRSIALIRAKGAQAMIVEMKPGAAPHEILSEVTSIINQKQDRNKWKLKNVSYESIKNS